MKVYDVYVGGIYFFDHRANSTKEAENKTKIQIENLHPLNMSADNLENYRNRYRNQPIEAFERFTKHKYNSK